MALNSQDDFDVIECGKLTGLSCAGEYVFATGYYKTGDTYNEDTFLTYDADTGDIKEAAVGDVIIGQCADGLRGVRDLEALKEMSYADDAQVVVFAANYSGLKLQA